LLQGGARLYSKASNEHGRSMTTVI
jgi:hypothetical protein